MIIELADDIDIATLDEFYKQNYYLIKDVKF
jgi:hypothetical protein